MNKILVCLMLIISVMYFPADNLLANNNYKTFKGKSSDSALIIKLENDWAKALIARDKKTVNQLLADDFIYTENEKMYSRAEVTAAAISETERIETAYNEDMRVHMKGITAIVTGWLYVNGKSGATGFKRKYRFTDIWFNKNGAWQLTAAQDYLLP